MKRLLAAFALLVALALPASASASVHHPTGGFAPFGECPLSNTKIFTCMYSETTSGYVKLGAKTVPIKNPVVLQGGLERIESGATPFVPAEGGNTLTKVPQPVPGGLTGIVAPSWWPSLLKELFNETINNGFTGVTATMELVGPAQVNTNALLGGSGTAVSLPVRVKLDNPFLGSGCYIGSSSNPIRLNLTDGTTSPPPPNTPITGAIGSGSESEGGNLITVTGQKLVDNSFAAPGANGCGGILFSWAVDPFVNSIVGVPSPAGTNTAILEGRLLLANPAAVKASE
jgi:opacity protein-like surface antigen